MGATFSPVKQSSVSASEALADNLSRRRRAYREAQAGARGVSFDGKRKKNDMRPRVVFVGTATATATATIMTGGEGQ